MPRCELYLALLGLLALMPPSLLLAATPAGVTSWSMSDARSAQTTQFGEFSVKTGQLQWRNVGDTESILQVVVLVESASGAIGPIRFSEILLKPAPGVSRPNPAGLDPATLAFVPFAAGTWNDGCTFLDGREIPENGQATITLLSRHTFTLKNVGGTMLQLAADARSLYLCFAFAIPRTLSGDWVLEAGRFALPVAQGVPPAAASHKIAQNQGTDNSLAQTANVLRSVDSGLAKTGWISAGAVASLVAVMYFFRRRVGETWQRSGTDGLSNDVDSAEPTIPELLEADLPAAFSVPEKDPGAGGLMLVAASSAIQFEDYESAGDFLRQALELGLSPGHTGQARLLLAETAMARGDLLHAIHEYRRCLQGDRVMLWSALPAATNLALIYRKLGRHRSATNAERIIALAPISGETLHPSRVRQIGRLAAELKKSLGARRLQSWVQRGRQFLQSLFQPTADTK